MGITTLDRLARTLALAGTRRAAIGTVVAGAGSALGLSGGQRVAAQASCTPHGKRCQDGAECCSGRCHRRHRTGPKVCRQAANQGICTVEQGDYCTDAAVSCGTHDGGTNCFCVVTTRGRSFCGALTGACNCTTSTECEQRVGKGARCIQNGPQCITCGTGTICALPCASPDRV